MVNSYTYMNEDKIDDELKCAVCQQPFREPMSSTQCHHTFCKECIITFLKQESRCPLCRAYFDRELCQPVRSCALLNEPNHLLVRCDVCQMRDIQHGDFQAQRQNCANWTIPCIAADIICKWEGTRDQLDNHVRSCPFQQIRPIIDDFYEQINHLRQQIESQNQQINFLQIE